MSSLIRHNNITLVCSVLTGLLIIGITICNGITSLYLYEKIFAAGLCVLPLTAIYLISSRRVEITLTDILVTAYLTASILNILFVADNPADKLLFPEWVVLIAFYLCGRLAGKRDVDTIILFIVVSGLIQSVIGFMQAAEWLPSNHAKFETTGSFFNPGPWGGYVGICLALLVTFVVIRLKQRTRLWYLFLFAILVLAVSCVISDSRAAWASVLTVVLFIILIRQSRKNIAVIFGGSLVLISVTALILYNYKKDSADGRLFIWKVSAEMIAEKPLFGHGVQSFPADYMLYQGNYFKNNPDSQMAQFAGNNYYAFNEFIRITAEQGIVGLLLFLSILASVFFDKRKDGSILTVKCGLLALIVFSCFSYPSNVLPLKILYPLFLGMLANRKIIQICSLKYQIITKTAAIAIIILLITGLILEKNKYNRAFVFLECLDDSSMDIATEASLWFEEMKTDRTFVRKYSRILYDKKEYDLCKLPTEIAVGKAHSSVIMCNLGDIYFGLHEYKTAEKCYLAASFMTPGYMQPRYKLFILSQEQGDTIKARVAAEEILYKKVKIINSAVIKARVEANNYLNEVK